MKTEANRVSIDRRQGVPNVLVGLAIAISVIAAAYWLGAGRIRVRFDPSRIHLHAPNLALVAAAPVQIRLHLAAALIALAIGTVLMIGVKGTRLHRALGWTWVAAMATTAVSSLFIKTAFAPGHFGLIHLLSGWTIIALPMAVYAARRHKVAHHRRAMTGLFVGGLLLAGVLTFIPGRLMWNLFFT